MGILDTLLGRNADPANLDTATGLTQANQAQALYRALAQMGAAAPGHTIGKPAPGWGAVLGAGAKGLGSAQDDLLKQQQTALALGIKKQIADAAKAKALQKSLALDAAAKVEEDFKAGRISKEVRDARIAKLTGESDLVKMAQALTNKETEFGRSDDEDVRKRILNPNTGSLIRTERLIDLMSKPETQTGTFVGSSAVQGLQGLADDFGVDLSKAAKKLGYNLGNLSDKQQFDRLTKEVISEAAQQFKGSLSNKELDFSINANANVGRSEEDNIRAVAAMKATEELQAQRREQLIAEEEKTPSQRRAALTRFRKQAKGGVPFLRKRTAEIAAEIRKSRAEGTTSSPAIAGDAPPPGLPPGGTWGTSPSGKKQYTVGGKSYIWIPD